jgi:hypothetical protein
MYPVKLRKDGSLPNVFKPAIYVDTNFLRKYENAEGAEFFVDENGKDIEPPFAEDMLGERAQEDPRRKVMLDIIHKPAHDARDYAVLRHIVINGLSEASLVMTPLAVLELYKLEAEVSFKDLSAYWTPLLMCFLQILSWNKYKSGRYLLLVKSSKPDNIGIALKTSKITQKSCEPFSPVDKQKHNDNIEA